MDNKIALLKLLEENPRLTVAQLAQMADIPLTEAEATIHECEQNHTILGYRTMIDSLMNASLFFWAGAETNNEN